MSETPNPPPPMDPIPTPPVDPIPTPPLSGQAPEPTDAEKNKVFALLSYLGILWLVPLLAAKDSPFAKFHANQGLALFLASIVIWFPLVIISVILRFIPFLGWLLSCFSCFLFPAVMLAILAYTIIGILNAVNGKMKPLPGFPVVRIIK